MAREEKKQQQQTEEQPTSAALGDEEAEIQAMAEEMARAQRIETLARRRADQLLLQYGRGVSGPGFDSNNPYGVQPGQAATFIVKGKRVFPDGQRAAASGPTVQTLPSQRRQQDRGLE